MTVQQPLQLKEYPRGLLDAPNGRFSGPPSPTVVRLPPIGGLRAYLALWRLVDHVLGHWAISTKGKAGQCWADGEGFREWLGRQAKGHVVEGVGCNAGAVGVVIL